MHVLIFFISFFHFGGEVAVGENTPGGLPRVSNARELLNVPSDHSVDIAAGYAAHAVGLADVVTGPLLKKRSGTNSKVLLPH